MITSSSHHFMLLLFLALAVCVLSFYSYMNHQNAVTSTPVTFENIPNLLVGKTVEAANELCTQENLKVRVVAVDGEYYPITTDFKNDRVNLVIVDGKVQRAYMG